jgi:outer membrane protein OmpA-like peptidoglycan-associated protein
VFAPGGFALLPSAEPQLADILATATSTEGEIVLHGHSDSTGDAAENLDLSRRRAESVRQWLTSRGIASDRISITAWGERCPIRSNSTQLGRETNRRVDVQLTP